MAPPNLMGARGHGTPPERITGRISGHLRVPQATGLTVCRDRARTPALATARAHESKAVSACGPAASILCNTTGSENPDYGGAVGVEEGQVGVHRTPPGSRTRWQASPEQERRKGRPARLGAALPL